MKRPSTCAVVLASAAASASALAGSADGPYVLSDANAARVFHGVGGISGGGATSRLLFDYPEPQRSQVLDLLFKPQYGAALQIHKVEIGGDADTTNGAEPSHRHDAADGGSYNRGYEWWLLKESLARNPSIVTSGLMWAAPRFLGEHDISNGESLFTPTGLSYALDWIVGAKAVQNISLTVMSGGWNEHPHNSTWIKMLRAALDASPSNLSHVRIASSDEWDPNVVWSLAKEMTSDPDLRAAVDYVSTHVAGYMDHNDPAPASVLSMGTPLWQGEEHFGLPDGDSAACWDWAAAGSLGVEISQNWVRNNMSATIMWPHTYGWSAGIIYRGKGFLTATGPWGTGVDTAFVTVCTPLWIAAHTTHFTAAGSWWLLNGTGSGHISPELYGNNVSYVTYVAPPASAADADADASPRDFTLVIESLSLGPIGSSSINGGSLASQPITATFQLAGGLLTAWAGAQLNVWHTNQSVSFERQANVTVGADGTFSVTIEPAAIMTLTTVASDHPGAAAVVKSLGPAFTAVQSAPVDAPFPLPWSDDFEGYANDTLPLYGSDMFGSFATWALTEVERGLPSLPQPAVGFESAACSSAADVALRPGRCSAVAVAARSHQKGHSTNSNRMVLRQYVRQPPIGWGGDSSNMATIWGNYSLHSVRLNVSALIETPTPVTAGGDGMRTTDVSVAQSQAYGSESVYVGLRGGDPRACAGCSSPSAFYGAHVSAYAWRLFVNGSWVLTDGSASLGSGTLPQPFGYDSWHALSLEDAPTGSDGGLALIGTIDGAVAFNVSIAAGAVTRQGGYVVLGTGCNRAQWDNLVIDRTQLLAAIAG